MPVCVPILHQYSASTRNLTMVLAGTAPAANFHLGRKNALIFKMISNRFKQSYMECYLLKTTTQRIETRSTSIIGSILAILIFLLVIWILFFKKQLDDRLISNALLSNFSNYGILHLFSFCRILNLNARKYWFYSYCFQICELIQNNLDICIQGSASFYW